MLVLQSGGCKLRTDHISLILTPQLCPPPALSPGSVTTIYQGDTNTNTQIQQPPTTERMALITTYTIAHSTSFIALTLFYQRKLSPGESQRMNKHYEMVKFQDDH